MTFGVQSQKPVYGGDGLTAHDIASRGGGMGSSVIRLSASALEFGG